MNDIIFCKSEGRYTNFYLQNGKISISSKNIGDYENRILDKNIFFRIHNSHIVNLNRIIKYNKGRGGTLTMDDGSQIEVASRRKTDFLNIFQ
jgi:two-component system LytT family response regulator